MDARRVGVVAADLMEALGMIRDVQMQLEDGLQKQDEDE